MDRELCFVIESKELFLDKILVEFNNFPIFFICFDDNNNYYLILCRDTELLDYVIVESSARIIFDMLTQKLSIKQAFIQQDFFWNVLTNTEMKDDKVQKLNISELDLSFLPNENVYYEAQSAVDVDYMIEISDKL